ncbi:MAG: hypothetical protein ACSLFR_14735 [Solirubrobacteraceae bacterium]
MSADLSLDDARSSLAYWEHRAERLPRRAVRARREAHAMAARWRGRVTDAERNVYGTGIFAILLALFVEGRVPETTRHAGRRAARIGTRIAVGAVVVTATFMLLLALLVVAAALIALGAVL